MSNYSPYSESEQKANVDRVVGAEVTLRRYLTRKHPPIARIKSYRPPCVWELDRELGSPKNSFQFDRDVCLLNGAEVGSLIPDKDPAQSVAG